MVTHIGPEGRVLEVDGVSHCILHNTSCGLLAIAVTYCEHEQIQDSENISFSIAEDDKDSNASERFYEAGPTVLQNS